MRRGTDDGINKTGNKFVKTIGTRTAVLEVGSAPHQYTIERLRAGERPEDFRADEIDEILEIFDPRPGGPNERPELMTKAEVAALLAEKKASWEADNQAEAKREKEAKFDADAPHGGLDEFTEIGRSDASKPNAKRGPGRPRKVDREADPTAEVPA